MTACVASLTVPLPGANVRATRVGTRRAYVGTSCPDPCRCCPPVPILLLRRAGKSFGRLSQLRSPANGTVFFGELPQVAFSSFLTSAGYFAGFLPFGRGEGRLDPADGFTKNSPRGTSSAAASLSRRSTVTLASSRSISL